MANSNFSVPNWFVNVVKWFSPALAVGMLMYVHQALMQKDIEGLKDRLTMIQSATDNRNDAMTTLNQRIGNAEVKQTIEGKGITDALARIEGTIKEMQTDIKDINRRIPDKK